MKKQKPIKIILFKITTIIISFLFCIFCIEFLLGFIKIKKMIMVMYMELWVKADVSRKTLKVM